MAEPPAPGLPALPKLQAVARAAGVSVSTVSKVLNGRPDVAPATRRRVADLLGRAGYPEVGSRRGAVGNLVEVVAHRLDDRLTSKLLREVCLAAFARGMGVVVTDVESTAGRTGRHPPRRWLDAMDARGAGAAISLLMDFSDAQLAYFDAHGVAACTIGADERDLGRVAVRHLLGLGHGRLAAVAGPDHPRLVLGCREALLEADVHTPDEYLPAGADVRQATLDLLALPTPPSALVFADAAAARVGCAVIAEAGLRVPGDVSVVCCGGVPGPVTTVVRALDEMARAALDLVSGDERGARAVAVRPRLVDRGSTAPPRPPDQRR